MRLLADATTKPLLDPTVAARGGLLVLAALLAAAVLVPAPAAATYDGVTGDYAWLDTPADGATVYGATVLTGRAGNNLTSGAPPGSVETDPIRDDAQGDSGGVGDVGNVWVTNDTGSRFQINLRLHDEGPLLNVNPVAETPYMVEFTHDGTGVRYGVGASQFLGPGYDGLYAGTGIEYVLWVQSDNVDWCRYQPLWGNLTNGVLTWDVPYAVLNVATQPDAPFIDAAFVGFLLTPYEDCDPAWVTGPAAVVGDVLSWFHARYWPQAGPGEFFLHRQNGLGDESNGAVNHTYTLGSLPPGSTPGSTPSGPFGPVNLTVNGVPADVPFQTNGAGQWNRTIDFSLFTPVNGRFRVNVTFGTAWDEHVYLLGNAPFPRAGGSPPGHVDSAPPRMEGEAPPGAAADTDEGPVWDPRGGLGGCSGSDGDRDGRPDACDADRDGDGLNNGVDNCPLRTNPDQKDTDRNGVGDACEADRDGDGFSDGLDLCPFLADGQQDLDRDGVGDACDPDVDGDGVANEQDLFPLDLLESADLDGDGVGDHRDLDVDGDGHGNAAERAAGTDPYDPASKPEALRGPRDRPLLPIGPASVQGLGAVALVAAFVLFGLFLVPMTRRR